MQARCRRIRSSGMPAVEAKATVLRWQCSRRDVSTGKASEEGEDCQTGDLVRGHVVRRSHSVTSQDSARYHHGGFDLCPSIPPESIRMHTPPTTHGNAVSQDPARTIVIAHRSDVVLLPSHPRLAPATLPN